MTFAELFLRLGVTSVAWIVVYMHLLAVLVVQLGECPGGDLGPWQMTALTGALGLLGSFFLTRAHVLPDVARVVRLFAMPLVVLLPLAAWTVWPYLTETTLGARSLCDVRLGTAGRWPRTGPMPLWAPAQLVTLAAITWFGLRAWRRRGRRAAAG